MTVMQATAAPQNQFDRTAEMQPKDKSRELTWRQLDLCTHYLTRNSENSPKANRACKLALQYFSQIDIDLAENRVQAQVRLKAALAGLRRDASPKMYLELATLLGHIFVLDQNWKAATDVLADGRQTFELLYPKLGA